MPHLERGPTSHVARLILSSHRTRTSNKTTHLEHITESIRLIPNREQEPCGLCPLSALTSPLMPRPRRTAAPHVHVCVAPVPDSVDDDVVLPDRSERPTDQNARAACHYLGRSHTTPCHPRRRSLPLPAMPTDAAACFASPDGLRSGRRSGLGWHPDVGRSLLGGGLGRLRLGGASNRCFVIV